MEDNPASGAGSSPAPGSRGDSKLPRNRIRFSCTTCREKKLKCNRMSPCDQCDKRGITSTCTYVPYLYPKGHARSGAGSSRVPARVPATSSEANLQSRLRHLESLVQDLRSQLAGQEESPNQPTSRDEDGSETAPIFASDLTPYMTPTEIPVLDAMLDEIEDMAGNLSIMHERQGDSDEDIPPQPMSGPDLLLGTHGGVTCEELVNHLPEKLVLDRLITRFFQGTEPGWMMFHVPTFNKQYSEFWSNPHQVTPNFLAVLNLMISHAALVCLRADEDVPGLPDAPMDVINKYSVKSAQCLSLSDWTRPGPYKVEALVMYYAIEYLKLRDTQIGLNVLWGAIMRLAIVSGYHKDGKYNKQISPFESEMRRRAWAVIVDIDILTAFQSGLPTAITQDAHDTEAPHNLHDEDFNPSSEDLPPSRPETEHTRALFHIVKRRFSRCFQRIITTVTSSNPPSYVDIMALEQELMVIYQNVPSDLRIQEPKPSDRVDKLLRRYWLEMLMHKARMVLHRKYLGVAQTDPKFAYSHSACLDSAVKVLHHQYDIHMASRPGGSLAQDRWYQNSISTHDFLLAAMILCLALSYLIRSEGSGSIKTELPRDNLPSKKQILDILDTSRTVWKQTRKGSAEANRAFKTLSSMLSYATGQSTGASPVSSGGSEQSEINKPSPYSAPRTPHNIGAFYGAMPIPQPATGVQDGAMGFPQANVVTQIPMGGPPMSWANPATMSQLQGVDAWTSQPIPDPMQTFSFEANDWTMWDNQIQTAGVEIPQTTWSNFFQPSGP